MHDTAGQGNPAPAAPLLAISNLGMYGVKEFAAIIPPGCSSVLAMGAVREAPVVHHGAVADRKNSDRDALGRPSGHRWHCRRAFSRKDAVSLELTMTGTTIAKAAGLSEFRSHPNVSPDAALPDVRGSRVLPVPARPHAGNHPPGAGTGGFRGGSMLGAAARRYDHQHPPPARTCRGARRSGQQL